MCASSTAQAYDIGALRARDPVAFERLVRCESPRLYHFILRMVRDEEEARNLLQETFLQALMGIDRFRGDAKITTWLYGIALNLSRTFISKAKRSYNVFTEAQIEQLQPSFGAHGRHVASFTTWNPEAITERKERAALVHEAIDLLPEDFRAVVILRDLEQRSTREAAQLLHISESNVRVRLHRARQALRSLLAPYFSREQSIGPAPPAPERVARTAQPELL